MADRFGRVDEEDEEESEEETFASSQDYKRPQLDPTSEGIITSLLCPQATLCKADTSVWIISVLSLRAVYFIASQNMTVEWQACLKLSVS